MGFNSDISMDSKYPGEKTFFFLKVNLSIWSLKRRADLIIGTIGWVNLRFPIQPLSLGAQFNPCSAGLRALATTPALRRKSKHPNPSFGLHSEDKSPKLGTAAFKL